MSSFVWALLFRMGFIIQIILRPILSYTQIWYLFHRRKSFLRLFHLRLFHFIFSNACLFFPQRSQSITPLKMVFNVVIHLPFTSLIYGSIPKPNSTLNKKTYSAKKKTYGNEIRRKVSAYHQKSSPRHVFQWHLSRTIRVTAPISSNPLLGGKKYS